MENTNYSAVKRSTDRYLQQMELMQSGIRKSYVWVFNRGVDDAVKTANVRFPDKPDRIGAAWSAGPVRTVQGGAVKELKAEFKKAGGQKRLLENIQAFADKKMNIEFAREMEVVRNACNG